MRRRVSGDAVRLAAFYAAFFLAIGVLQPFWPLWLKAKGLNDGAIGLTLAFSIGLKVLSTPVAAHVADRTGTRRPPMQVLLAVSAVSFALFGLADGLWSILAVSAVFYAAWPPVMSLGESLTMLAAQRRGFEYGRVRLWGSLSFIVAAVGAGAILARGSADLVYWLILGAVVVTALSGLALPDLRGERSLSARLPVIETIRQPGFLVCLTACGLIQGSHAVYYAFGALHWQAAGYGEDVIGALWAEGVVAEIVLFACGRSLVRRLGPGGLIVAAGCGCVVRWLVAAVTTALPALIAIQALHAWSFAAAHLGAMHFIVGAVQPRLSATAQSLYSGVVWGLCLGLMLLVAGELYGQLSAGAYGAMAAAGGLGAAVASRLRVGHRDRRSRGAPSAP